MPSALWNIPFHSAYDRWPVAMHSRISGSIRSFQYLFIKNLIMWLLMNLDDKYVINLWTISRDIGLPVLDFCCKKFARLFHLNLQRCLEKWYMHRSKLPSLASSDKLFHISTLLQLMQGVRCTKWIYRAACIFNFRKFALDSMKICGKNYF